MKRRDGYWLDGEYMSFFVYEKLFLAFDVFVLDSDGGLHSAHGVSGCDTNEQMLEWMAEYDTPKMQAKYLRIWVERKPNRVLIEASPIISRPEYQWNYTAPYGNDCPDCDDGA